MNRTRKALTYLLLDLIASYCVWLIFFIFRRYVFESESFAFNDKKFFVQLIPAAVVSVYWVIVYAIAGLYTDPYRKSRLGEIVQVFKFTFIGVLIIFFLIFFNDPVPDLSGYRYHINYFFLQFVVIGLIHFAISSHTNYLLRRRKIGYPTLIIGCGEEAMRIWKELESRKRSLGFKFKGFLHLPDKSKNHFLGKLKNFGSIERLDEVIRGRKIEEVIVALDTEDKEKLTGVIDRLEGLPVKVKIVPGIYDFIMGRVKTTHIMGSPLIEIFPQILSTTEAFIKRAMDVVVSLLALAILSLLYLVIAILVKLNSKGPVFYRQERIGKWGRPFKIIKFRTMYINAESAGPALSSSHDPRITRVGRILRKTRLDELPQFWNVLVGEMSLVGPRPERQFFIDQIMEKAPHYRHLHRVRPGITSWGQVKFGYAENVDEMVERLKFDILYIENMSLLLDLKILFYTVWVMIEGRGK